MDYAEKIPPMDRETDILVKRLEETVGFMNRAGERLGMVADRLLGSLPSNVAMASGLSTVSSGGSLNELRRLLSDADAASNRISNALERLEQV